MKKQPLMLAALAALLFCVPCSTAQASDGLGGYGYGYLYHSLDYRVPYFAAHPPVYYSYPVSRTYGYSPFAYPPGVKTPDAPAAAVVPLQVINPHVPRSKNGQETQDRSTSVKRKTLAKRKTEPLVIINPYARPNLSMVYTD